MKVVRSFIASSGIPSLEVRSVGWHSKSRREKKGNKLRTDDDLFCKTRYGNSTSKFQPNHLYYYRAATSINHSLNFSSEKTWRGSQRCTVKDTIWFPIPEWSKWTSMTFVQLTKGHHRLGSHLHRMGILKSLGSCVTAETPGYYSGQRYEVLL